MSWNEARANAARTEAAFREAARPLIEWIRTVYPHPHARVIVDCDGAEAVTGDFNVYLVSPGPDLDATADYQHKVESALWGVVSAANKLDVPPHMMDAIDHAETVLARKAGSAEVRSDGE